MSHQHKDVDIDDSSRIERSQLTQNDYVVGKIDDNFTVTPLGQVNYDIPIPVIPGSGGIAPKLSIVYDSSRKFGLFGYGFDLEGLSIINRTPKNRFNDGVAGVVNFTSSDQLSIDGARMILVGSQTGCHEYRTENNSFSKIMSYGSLADPDSFIVKTKTGLTYLYKSNTDLLNRPSEVGLFWMLTKVSDTMGNYFTVTYEGHDEEWNNTIYPVRIDYTGNDQEGFSPYASVRFVYNTSVAFKHTTYVSGKWVLRDRYISRIDVYSGEIRERYFRIDYKKIESSSLIYLVDKITEVAADGKEKKPTVFRWDRYDAYYISQETSNTPLIDDAVITVGDYNGDGKSDFIATPKDNDAGWDHKEWRLFLSQNGTPTYHACGTFNFDNEIRDVVSGDFNGDGYDDFAVLTYFCDGSSSPEHYATYFYYSHVADGTVTFVKSNYEIIYQQRYTIQAMEHNGDGRTDLFLFFPGTKQYVMKISTGNSFSTTASASFPSGSYDRMYCVDANGDGLTDFLLLYQNACYLFASNGNGTLSSMNWLMGRINSSYTTYNGDFNGDGKTDMLVTSWNNETWSNWHLYLSSGDGSYYVDYISCLCQTNEYNLYTGDINGDGFDDLYAVKKEPDYQGQASLGVFMNKANGSFYDCDVNAMSYPANNSLVYSGDFNGDGRTDLVTTSDWEHSDRLGYKMFLTPEMNCNMLSKITDGFGNETVITYKNMTDSTVHQRGSISSYPLTSFSPAWPVVYQVTTPNGIGGTNRTTYTYKNALLHRDGRGVLGFEYVIVNNEALNTVTTTQYEINATKYVLNPKYVRTKINGHTVSESFLYNGQQNYGHGVFTCMPDSTIEKKYEYNRGTLVSYEKTIYGYDPLGNPTSVITTNGDVTTTTINTYDDDTQKWYIGRLTESQVTKTNGSESVSHLTRFEYDNSSGLLTKELYEPNNTLLGYKKEYDHDRYGNIIISETTPNNPLFNSRAVSTTYDLTGRYIECKTNSLGYSVHNMYNPNNGQLYSSTDDNDFTTEYSYDSFGHQTGAFSPIDSTLTTTGWSNGMADAPERALYYIATHSTGKPDKVEFYDSFGRILRTVTTTIINQKTYTDVVYNNSGLVIKVSEPYYPSSTIYWNTTVYDSFRRPFRKVDGANHLTKIDYDGFETTVTDALGHKTIRRMDINGNLIQVEDNVGNTIDYEYDVNGHCTKLSGPRKIVLMGYDAMGNRNYLNDPDMGIVESTYNAFGELVSQTDQKGTTTYTYDEGGRLIQEARADVTINSIYDLDYLETLSRTTSSNGTSIDYSYDGYGRIIQEVETINGRTFTTSTTYNNQNKVATLTYPSGLVIQNNYSANGYLQSVKNATTQAILWKINNQNARGQSTRETYGNGLISNTGYDNATGMVTSISTSNIQNWTYGYDAIGNLSQRRDITKNLTESFSYDTLNRLTEVRKNGQLTQQMIYDAAGNILSKTGVGHDFVYRDSTNRLVSFMPDSPMPQQWDNIQYTSFHKISYISQGGDYLSLMYGPDKSRCKSVIQRSGEVETKYYIGSLYEETVKNGETKQTCYIFANGKAIAISETSSITGNSVLYLHHDHLGSVQAYSDASGHLAQELSYDAWGRRRNPATWEYYSSVIEANAINPWGFTGHEHIDLFEMVNMDGRMYDPVLGRFLSPDPIVQAPDLTQGLNRYTYCLNNPLSLVDPTGYSWLGDNWQTLVASFVGIAVSAITAGTGASLGVAIIAGAAGGAASALTGALLNGANIGQIAKATFTGAVWGGVSAAFSFASADEDLIAQLFKHAFTDGIYEGIQGGNMFHGMMMGVVSSGGGYMINRYASSLGRFGEISTNAVLSGTIDELGGGKFANGAVTGAFSIMFNDMMHPQKEEKKTICIDIECVPHSELIETAAISAMAGTVLLSDDISGVGVADDPLAAICFIVSSAATTTYVAVTTIDTFNNIYHIMKAEHKKNSRPSTKDKHTKHRPGESYGQNRNKNRGNKNKKNEHPINPNKRKK